MSSAPKSSNNSSNLQWDARTADLRLTTDNWGLDAGLIPDALDILEQQNLLPAGHAAQDTISFVMFRDLVTVLGSGMKSTGDLSEAIRNYKRQQDLPQPFNNHWVLVVGSNEDIISEPERKTAAALGRALARAGYGLICGGWAGVDEAALFGFYDYLREHAEHDRGRLLQLLERGQKGIPGRGRTEQLKSKLSWYEEALQRCSCVVMIGGARGTYTTYKTAEIQAMPVIPVPYPDRDSRKAYLELTAEQATVTYKNALQRLDMPVETERQAEQLARYILEIIAGLDLQPIRQSLTEKEFKAVVEKLYAERPITVPDDLQKNRWGGAAEVNGKVLEAGVRKGITGAYFGLALNVKSATGKALRGHVAFFIHNSFNTEIEYEEATKGIAQLNEISVYEGFTVGAYTEDGTMLELDLNEQSGYPEGFYCKDVAPAFKERVAALYASRPVTVADDPQKNRWGGRPVQNGKEIKAAVKESDVPGSYNIHIEVRSESGRVLNGDVALFLHSSSGKEIIYRKFTRQGIAPFHIKAVQAFTIGAYTDDGAMLELDLQRKSGYPKRFYRDEEERDKSSRYKK